MNDSSKERQEKVKHYQKMTAFYEGKKQELEARVADVQAIKVEAATAWDCKHWDSCDFPLCPLDQQTMEWGAGARTRISALAVRTGLASNGSRTSAR